MVVHHDVLHVQAGLVVFVHGLAQEMGMRDFIPEVDRAGIVAQEHQVEFLRRDELLQDVAPAARGIDEHGVIIPLRDRGRLLDARHRRQREDLQREVRLGLELGQFAQ